MANCKHCGKLTKNEFYCSVTCSTSKSALVTRKNFCECGQFVGAGRKRCITCHQKWVKSVKCKSPELSAISSQTIKEIKLKAKMTWSARIRNHARKSYKFYGLPNACNVCGYDKIIQICHKKAISSFSDDTPISEVNAQSNLIGLCPNHHWEFDHPDAQNNLIELCHNHLESAHPETKSKTRKQRQPRYKIKWPENLSDMVSKSSKRAVAAQLGVSDKAVSKRLKAMGA